MYVRSGAAGGKGKASGATNKPYGRAPTRQYTRVCDQNHTESVVRDGEVLPSPNSERRQVGVGLAWGLLQNESEVRTREGK